MRAISERSAQGRQAADAALAEAARTDAPWQRVLAGLHHNRQQFGANMAQLQRHFTAAGQGLHAALAPRSRAAVPCVASLSSSAAGALAPQSAYPDAASSSWYDSSSTMSSGSGAVSREEVGRATWTFLHTLAAQYPEHPTRQQQKDAKNLVGAPGDLVQQARQGAGPRVALRHQCWLRGAAGSVPAAQQSKAFIARLSRRPAGITACPSTPHTRRSTS